MRAVGRGITAVASLLVGGLVAEVVQPLAAQTRLPRPVRGTPTIIPAGPTWISAGSDYPTDFVIKWTAVANASTYRLWRWNDAGENKFFRQEVAAGLLNSPTEPGYARYTDNLRIDVNSAYSYQVEAIFYDAAGQATVSLPSPVGTARSVPYLAPANLRYTTTPSPGPGAFALTLSFDPVVAAAYYRFTGTTTSRGSILTLKPANVGPGSILIDANPATSFPPSYNLLRIPLYAHETYTLCLSTVYPNGVRDDSVKSCVTVPL